MTNLSSAILEGLSGIIFKYKVNIAGVIWWLYEPRTDWTSHSAILSMDILSSTIKCSSVVKYAFLITDLLLKLVYF